MTTMQERTVTHPRLTAWVEEIAHLARPDEVVWCDWSQREYD